MSGTSLDGVDAVLVDFSARDGQFCQILGTCFTAYTPALRQDLLALHVTSENELERTALMANQLAMLYGQAVDHLLRDAGTAPALVEAIGSHGQTIRHRPELGFTLQIGNAALLAELTGIEVVTDFRSRDIAAGGQGAPLVPAFHQAVFADAAHNRVIVNIGGIANLTGLSADKQVSGFDSGPGNMLMDAWTELNLGKPYDASGDWAASGRLIDELLEVLLAHEFFRLAPPKSTGRELFNLPWLQQHLQANYKAEDVQHTLLEFTARSIAEAIHRHYGKTDEVYICGGGAHNQALLQRLQQLLTARISLTDDLGISADWVEATAFAWLASQCLQRQAANLPAVTGAQGLRILGAIYPH